MVGTVPRDNQFSVHIVNSKRRECENSANNEKSYTRKKRANESMIVGRKVPASVTNISNNIIVKEGQNVTLACHGFGFPAPIITWSDAWNQVMENGHILQLPKINRNMAGQYSCTASNSCGTDSRKVDIDVRYPVEATGRGKNAFVAKGIVKTFTCPVNGNPEPNIEWYSEKTGRKISSGKQYKAAESGCYSCVASNSLGTAVNITQCLIVVYESSPTVPSSTVSGGQEIRAILTIITNFRQAFKDLYSASSKQFVAKFEKEVHLHVISVSEILVDRTSYATRMQ
ncbi:PREDICTED: limbic system-associated membrane protein-like [Acropora digitifera]|uniref:limbic system-associated membrane protein-like n=1 Tax=Acropora digitifera TaxID=70779 RepID=UPI00077A1992|nr:PREDICTED: limbic system-associated membrane protein-like [Acropora digitifera]